MKEPQRSEITSSIVQPIILFLFKASVATAAKFDASESIPTVVKLKGSSNSAQTLKYV